MNLVGSLMVYTPAMSFWGAMVALGFALMWAFRFGKQPRRAVLMGVAFLVMAGLFFGYGQGWPTGGMIALGVVLFILLVLDLVMRTADMAREREAEKK